MSKITELTEAIEKLDTKYILDNQVRQVRWLYNNSNKCTNVYDEKLMRLVIQKLEVKLVEKEKEIDLLKRDKKN